MGIIHSFDEIKKFITEKKKFKHNFKLKDKNYNTSLEELKQIKKQKKKNITI